MKTQPLTHALGWALAIAQTIALIGYQLAGTSPPDALVDTATRLTWALGAWLAIHVWASIREPKPASPLLAPSPSSTRDMVRAAWGLDT